MIIDNTGAVALSIADAPRGESRSDPGCGRYAGEGPEISSKIGGNWGGPRVNSGGARANSGGVRPGAGRPRRAAAETAPVVSRQWAGPRWCVVVTYPQAERMAVEEMARAGYLAYLPLIAEARADAVVPSMRHVVRVPMFPGYAFVRLGPSDPWAPIRYCTAGVRDVLMADEMRPALVGVGVIETLQADDERRCQLVPEVMPVLATGARVRVSRGALAGSSGDVRQCDGRTTRVAMALFGRLVVVAIERAALVTE